MYKSSKSKVNRHKEQRQTTKASNGRQAGISVRHFPLDPVAPSVAKKEGMTVCILFAYIVTVFPYTLDTFRIYIRRRRSRTILVHRWALTLVRCDGCECWRKCKI